MEVVDEDEGQVDVQPRKRSPFNRLKSKIGHKLDDFTDDIHKEIREEIDDHGKEIQDAHNVALDLVDPGTLEKLIEIVREKPEIESGCDKKLWFHIVRKTFSNIIFKIIDIGTDIAAAVQHFKRSDWRWGILTLFFIYLPGFVLSSGFTFWGLFYKRDGDPPARKAITLERLGRYAGLLFLFPFFYPILVILMGVLLVGLLLRRRDHVARKFMGHDLKQFKSLEGFLESGPSFCLQSYILMVGQKKGTNIDWDNVQKDDVERLLLLSASVLFSFISLVKTSVSVNVPDPDDRRQVQQYPKNLRPGCFKFTLILFNLTCILYRIVGISYFCVYLKKYTLIFIIAGFLVNLITLLCVSASPTISIILGAISIFVPNGYILHNFAGTLAVDFTRSGSRIVFLTSTIAVNLIWACGIAGVAIKTGTHGFEQYHLISDAETQDKFVLGMNIALGAIGFLSTVLGFVHWFCSIEKLFDKPEEDLELKSNCEIVVEAPVAEELGGINDIS